MTTEILVQQRHTLGSEEDTPGILCGRVVAALTRY